MKIYRTHLLLCGGTSCHASGSEAIRDAFKEELAKMDLDKEIRMVDMARFFMDFIQDESCGECTPCREGTKRMLQILEKIKRGEGESGDIELLEELSEGIKDGALCGLGQTGPNPVLSTLQHFRDEYEAHIYEKRCPAKRCPALL